jgi:hypothetical protein
MWILNETEENQREIRLVRMINSEIEETKKYIKYLEELKSNPDEVAQLKEDKQSLENYKNKIAFPKLVRYTYFSSPLPFASCLLPKTHNFCTSAD